jgi:hypothetical protein
MGTQQEKCLSVRDEMYLLKTSYCYLNVQAYYLKGMLASHND